MRVPQIIAKATGWSGGVDEVKRDAIVKRFREAFEADVDEDTRADMVYEINRSMWGNPSMYAAVGRELGSRHKNAIRVYVQMVDDRRKPQKLGCDCEDGCRKCMPVVT
jgi:hypothetical protein